MNDERMKKALLNSFEQECDMIDRMEVPEYQTSEKFQSKMNKILQKSHKVKKVTGRFAAACAMIFFVLGTLASFTTYAASPALRSFIISIFDGESKISITDNEKSPEYIFTRYLPTSIPEGYEAREIPSVTNNSLMVSYVKEENQIFFGQYIKSIYKQVDMGMEKFEYYTDESGQEYVITGYDKEYTVIWDNGDYVLHIFSTLSKEETIEICLSVKPINE
ncbi:MAG: DUF4367 domain-containing protein [Clostridiaceae bacterium]|nr:DUF4367 domain-containing protein [Clostridiaceae bacterium]